jgi:DNA modification methylase
MKKRIRPGTIDLVCSDLDYGISKKSGFSQAGPNNKCSKKYSNYSIDFGKHDVTSPEKLQLFAENYYRVLRPGGVVIIFYDLFKSQDVIKAFYKFNQPRVLEWVKTNPVPVNSKINVLPNAREFMFCFVKGQKPTFNGEYHKGIFNHPICHGKERTAHKTQKPLSLIIELIELYSNPGYKILDSHLGSGTTGEACFKTGRKFVGFEKQKKFYKICERRLG